MHGENPKLVSKLLDEHTNLIGLPCFCCKIIQYQIS